jgi:hypothetical protein
MKDGKVVKEDDDLMSATRVLSMAHRHFKAMSDETFKHRQGAKRRGGLARIAVGVDDKHWGLDE